jgi:hypothetical protein
MFYVLRDWEMIWDRLFDLVPGRWRPKTREIAGEVDAVLAEFLRGQGMVMVSLALYYVIGLSVAGLQFALPIGILTGLLVFIPYVGFGTGFILGMLAALLQWEGIGPFLAILAVYGVGQILENYVLIPWLIGDRIGLHPLAVIFALLAFGALFGLAGVLLACRHRLHGSSGCGICARRTARARSTPKTTTKPDAAVEQLVFELVEPEPPAFRTFVAGRNGEAVAALERAAAGALAEPGIVLWGPPGAGKSHLLSATVAAARLPTACLALRLPASLRARPAPERSWRSTTSARRRGGPGELFTLYNVLRDRGGRSSPPPTPPAGSRFATTCAARGASSMRSSRSPTPRSPRRWPRTRARAASRCPTT